MSYDFLSGKPHPVTIAAREKLAAEEAGMDEATRASRVGAIDRAQRVAVSIERREARAREMEKQRAASDEMRANAHKPFAAFNRANGLGGRRAV